MAVRVPEEKTPFFKIAYFGSSPALSILLIETLRAVWIVF
jgi:hypothetical protein